MGGEVGAGAAGTKVLTGRRGSMGDVGGTSERVIGGAAITASTTGGFGATIRDSSGIGATGAVESAIG